MPNFFFDLQISGVKDANVLCTIYYLRSASSEYLPALRVAEPDLILYAYIFGHFLPVIQSTVYCTADIPFSRANFDGERGELIFSYDNNCSVSSRNQERLCGTQTHTVSTTSRLDQK